ncbi:MAG: GTP-binding protein, partial [Acidimicrobiales bacterium]
VGSEMARETESATSSVPLPVKIVIAGGYAVGKTTFVGSISEIDPLTTEAALTTVSRDVDNEGDASSKTSTTVAMDFGRVGLGDELVLYLFGTPGQDRFRFMWDELTRGAIGAVVLLDTRRFEDSFGAVEYFERANVPFVVAVNAFHGQLHHSLEAVREGLDLPDDIPIVATDARDRDRTKATLLELVEHALVRAQG